MLTYDRTVDRQMVHRAAVSEVFVTDAVRTAEMGVRVAVQLPPSHAHFGDHAREHVDPLLLLEAARQACIYGAHVVGIPFSDTILISSTRLAVHRPDLLDAASRPVRLVIPGEFVANRTGTRRAWRGYVEQRFELDDTVVGALRLDALVMTREQHAVLRTTVRDGPVPTTAQVPDHVHPRAVEPVRVGRTHPSNVVLAAHESGAGGHRALVAPRFGNRALFDHVYDHLPGAVLTEAARQLAAIAVGTPAFEVRGITARFIGFAELDLPTVARTPSAGQEVTQVPVSFSQNGTEIAVITVTLQPASLVAITSGGDR